MAPACHSGHGLVLEGAQRQAHQGIEGHHKGEHHCFGSENFVDATRRLASVAWKVERNEKKPLNGQGRADLLLDLLDDKFSVPFSNLVITRQVHPSTDGAEQLPASSQPTR
jgi:hypothetical protein